jgi:A/G-specific adenine glycosylase
VAYWHRFVKQYPTVRDLAAAPEDEVLKLWQGLGYYSRARNLLMAANQVVSNHGGSFPADIDELRSLKGVGDYTAAAIGSIAFNIPSAVVDGNVYRVLSRIHGISTPIDSMAGKKEFQIAANALLDRDAPGDHNQAMMELGALICTPRDPRCEECPAAKYCVARKEDRINDLPVKSKRTPVRTRHFNYFYIPSSEGFYLQKRTAKDIWHNLFELPLIESERPLTARQLKQQFSGEVRLVKLGPARRHILSHQRIEAIFWQVDALPTVKKEWIPVSFADLRKYALPRLIDRWLTEHAGTKKPHR